MKTTIAVCLLAAWSVGAQAQKPKPTPVNPGQATPARPIGAAADKATAVGANGKVPLPRPLPKMNFRFQWKADFTDKPRRIAVADVMGDG